MEASLLLSVRLCVNIHCWRIYVAETGNAVSLSCIYTILAKHVTKNGRKVRSCGNHGNATSLRTTTVSLNAIPLMERCHCPLSPKRTAGATSLMHQAGHCQTRDWLFVLAAIRQASQLSSGSSHQSWKHRHSVLMSFVTRFVLTE
jgi:hypothetical protein